nr:MAG TPA: hypothetical protein [Caudoviricetes sp.]
MERAGVRVPGRARGSTRWAGVWAYSLARLVWPCCLKNWMSA